jgi:hypothetical protein
MGSCIEKCYTSERIKSTVYQCSICGEKLSFERDRHICQGTPDNDTRTRTRTVIYRTVD